MLEKGLFLIYSVIILFLLIEVSAYAVEVKQKKRVIRTTIVCERLTRAIFNPSASTCLKINWEIIGFYFKFTWLLWKEGIHYSHDQEK